MTKELQSYRGDRLLPSFGRATVADVMRSGVVTCTPDASLVTVARAMANHRVHAVVVGGISPGGAAEPVWGVISDMALIRAARDGITGHYAGDIVEPDVVTVELSTLLPDVARVMDEEATAHLVVTSQGRPCGVVSSLAIAEALAWSPLPDTA